VNQDINSVEVHPQVSHKGHPVDGALVGAGLLWPSVSDRPSFCFGTAFRLTPKHT